MLYQVSCEEAKKNLKDLIQAAISGETVIIKDDDKTVVRLIPYLTPTGHRQFGSAKGKIHIADDFDAPLEDFAEYRS